MAMFGFDEQYAYYGVTPVDNQFILEYLPAATGDAVRVYLYGLMQCHHPEQTMTLPQMARELALSEEAVMSAYRYWERKGLVRRIADNPPAFRYVSLHQLALSGAALTVDVEYEQFAGAVYTLFGDRAIHGGEMQRIYEWVEDLHLPMDVVVYLIREMIAQHGKTVAVKTIEKRAIMLAEENVQCVEDAETVLTRDKDIWDGSRAVIRRLGKRRYPSEDEQAMFRTWHVDWGFSLEDILAACAETVKGEPTFAYLGGILSRLRAQKKTSGVEAALQQEKDAAAPLKALLKVMKLPHVTINQGTLAVYADMRAMYPDNIILMAGEECAKRGADFEGVMTTLKIWKRNGFETAAEINAYMRQVDEQNEYLVMLYELLGMHARPNAADRRFLSAWQSELGYDMGFISQVAPWAQGKDKPMVYLNHLLTDFHNKGVKDIESARAARESFAKAAAMADKPARSGKTVEQQNYTQREYTHSDDAMDAMMRTWQEENGDA